MNKKPEIEGIWGPVQVRGSKPNTYSSHNSSSMSPGPQRNRRPIIGLLQFPNATGYLAAHGMSQRIGPCVLLSYDAKE